MPQRWDVLRLVRFAGHSRAPGAHKAFELIQEIHDAGRSFGMIRIPEKANGFFQARPLSRRRIALALAIAVAADGLQLALSAFGWLGPDQVIDVLTMLVLVPLIGFHWLLLPSFVLELVPVLDDLPTWIACVVAVVAIRKHQFKAASQVNANKTGVAENSV